MTPRISGEGGGTGRRAGFRFQWVIPVRVRVSPLAPGDFDLRGIMSATIENLEGLKRRVVVVIPSEAVESAYQERLKAVAKTAKLAGFRPGKAPLNVLEKRYGKEVRAEVFRDLTESGIENAVKELNLRVAGVSPIEPPKATEVHGALEFVVHLEVYPTITLQTLQERHISRSIAEVTVQDVERGVETLRKQHTQWHTVERSAAEGDQVNIDFTLTVEGELVTEGDSQNHSVRLVAGEIFPELMQKLLGMVTGEARDVELMIPPDYPTEKIRGKLALFHITLNSVQEPHLLTDGELAQKLGFAEKGMEAVHDKVRRGIQQEVDRAVARQFKTQVLDQLIAANPIEVPDCLVQAEIDHLQKMAYRRIAALLPSGVDNAKLPTQFPREFYQEQAKRRVILGLLLAEVIQQNHIQLDSHRIRTKIEGITSGYDDAEKIASLYYNNKEMLSDIESSVLEDQAVEKLAESLEVKEEKVTCEDILVN